MKISRKLSGRDLYNICEGRRSLLVLGKTKSSPCILGGYNDSSWDDGLMQMENSFIFKMYLNENDNFRVARPKDGISTCSNNIDNGPGFGIGDLYPDGYNWKYSIKSYAPVFTYGTQELDIIEVYHVQKYSSSLL